MPAADPSTPDLSRARVVLVPPWNPDAPEVIQEFIESLPAPYSFTYDSHVKEARSILHAAAVPSGKVNMLKVAERLTGIRLAAAKGRKLPILRVLDLVSFLNEKTVRMRCLAKQVRTMLGLDGPTFAECVEKLKAAGMIETERDKAADWISVTMKGRRAATSEWIDGRKRKNGSKPKPKR